MDIAVTITDAGHLQVSVDGTVWAPLPVEAVQAMANMLPQAQAAAQRQSMTAAMRLLTDVLVSSGAGMSATVEVTATTVTAVVDDESFDRARQVLGTDPDSTGDSRAGPVVVRRPDPASGPPPDPGSPADPGVS